MRQTTGRAPRCWKCDSDEDAQGQKPSLVDGAYEALKEAIRNNAFPPGYQGSEQEIASGSA